MSQMSQSNVKSARYALRMRQLQEERAIQQREIDMEKRALAIEREILKTKYELLEQKYRKKIILQALGDIRKES